MAPVLTYDRLKQLLSYDPETGLWTWIAKSAPASRVIIGSVAGTTNSYGYITIKIDDRTYRAHRLAWLWMTGKWPKMDVDHKDTIKSNNQWSNLRECDDSLNVANTGITSANTSGFKGVSYVPHMDKFKAQIRHQGTVYYLGCFEKPEVAHEAYKAAARRYFGEFARFA